MARVLITYESMFGNTQDIADAISDGLRSVADMLGPLRPGELERARRWGVGLTAAIDLQAV